MTTGPRAIGDFNWINMITRDPAAAREFFSALFDWTYFDMGGIGHGIRVDGKDIGGMFDLDAPNNPPGTVTCIGTMTLVADADAISQRAIALGGRGMPAFDIGKGLRMAVIHSPSGVNVDVWQAKEYSGTTVDSTAHGAPVWFEMQADDVARDRRFYEELFGWTSRANPMGEFDYIEFQLDGRDVAGMLPSEESMAFMKSHPHVYFSVRDVAAAERVAVERGGSVTMPAMAVGTIGTMVGLRSPQGVGFFVIEAAGNR